MFCVAVFFILTPRVVASDCFVPPTLNVISRPQVLIRSTIQVRAEKRRLYFFFDPKSNLL